MNLPKGKNNSKEFAAKLQDVDLARCLLEQENLNLVIVKERQVLTTSKNEGIHPLFEAILDKGSSLFGAAIADKVMGAPVAMLCIYAQIASVYAGVASKGALAMLRGQGVTITSKNVVRHILNHEGTDLCPFEKLAQGVSSPSQFFSVLESFFAEGNQ
jgi:hypothetical protein